MAYTDPKTGLLYPSKEWMLANIMNLPEVQKAYPELMPKPITPAVPPVVPPPVVPPVAPPPTAPPVDIEAQKQAIQTQIADVQAKLAIAKTQLEKEKTIEDFIKTAAAAGIPFVDIQKYVASLTTPAKSEEELRKEVYAKYGISDLETKAFATPTETFESIYKRAYEQSGLADIKTKMSKVAEDLEKATADYNTAVGEINENPWLHEASRVGRIKRVYDMYEAKASRLQNEYTRLSNEYERGQQRAESVATRALSELEKGVTRTKEELSYYIKRAEADIEAEKGLAEEKEAKELYRYFPEYVKAKPKEVSTTGWQLKQKDTGEWVWMHPTKGEVSTGVTGKKPGTAPISRATLNKLNASGIKDDLALDIQQLFSQGYSEDQIKQAMKDAGYNPDLLNTFKDIVGKAGESIVIIQGE